MRRSDILERSGRRKFFEMAEKVESSKVSGFSELVRIAGLDPETDFQNSNLKGVDFSNSDLSSFNFRGADLSGSFGVNVKFPPLENLQFATIDDSVFRHAVETSKLFTATSGIRHLRFPNDDATTVSEWIYKNTAPGAKNREEAISTVLANLERVTNSTIIIDSMLAASSFFNDRLSYRDLLLGIISKHKSSPAVVIYVIKMLVETSRRDTLTVRTLWALLEHDPRPDVRLAAYGNLLRALEGEEKTVAHNLLFSNKFAFLRQHYIKRVIGSFADRCWFLFQDGSAQNELIFDVTNEASMEQLSMALDQLENSIAASRKRALGRSGQIDRKEIHENAKQVFIDRLQKLKGAKGVEFRFSRESLDFLGVADVYK